MTGKQSISYQGGTQIQALYEQSLWFLELEGEKKTLFESHQSIEVAETQISVLENLLFHIVKLVFRVRAPVCW